jgi:hypothetical protein
MLKLPHESGTPLRILPLREASSKYSPQSHQPHVLLSVLQDCRYGQCSRNYRHSEECNPETHLLSFLAFSLPNFSPGSTYLPGALRQCSGRTEFSYCPLRIRKKLNSRHHYSTPSLIFLSVTNRATRQALDLVFLHEFLSKRDLIRGLPIHAEDLLARSYKTLRVAMAF